MILATAACLLTVTAPESAATDDPRAPNVLDPSDAAVFRGEGFDTCSAPPLSTMDAWRGDSPYGAVGIYIGGRARGCSQEHLTPGWVASARSMGWQLLPIYVGSQAPCVLSERKQPFPIDTDYPGANGTEEGRDAIQRARALGIVERSPIYLDMEAYDLYDTECLGQVLEFVQAWSEEVRRGGYFAGFYSSASYGVRHLAEALHAGARDLPDIIWFGRWDAPVTLEDPALDLDDWQPHRRIHQYAGNTTETYGGETLDIDRNLVDAPVAVVGGTQQPLNQPQPQPQPGPGPQPGPRPQPQPQPGPLSGPLSGLESAPTPGSMGGAPATTSG